VLGVTGVADVILAGDHGAVGGALAAGAAVDHGPEVAAGVRVKRPALAGLEPYLPHPDVVVLEPQPGADVQVPRGCCELALVVGGIKGLLAQDRSGHSIFSFMPSLPSRCGRSA